MRYSSFILSIASALLVAAGCSGSGSAVTASADQLDYQVKGIDLKMVEVPAGSFTRGLTPAMRTIEGETVAFEVFGGYAISSSPVTSELWCAVMGGTAESGYAQKVSKSDAEKFVKKLSSITGQAFSLPTESQLEYAMRYGYGQFDKKFRFWVSESVNEKDLARDAEKRYEYAPGTKAGGLGVVIVFDNGKAVSDSYLAALEGKVSRETGEKVSETIEVNGVSFNMKRVPSGTIMMGGSEADQGQYAKDDEKPVHMITVDDFEMGETEVTVKLWSAVMGTLPTGNDAIKDADKPVVNVSWYDAQLFIMKLNSLTGRVFRLPTEAEWEFAAREGKSQNYRYSGSNTVEQVAVFGDERGGVRNVKTLSRTTLGLYDMCGNAWEWCSDWYGPYSDAAQTNPTGPTTGTDKVIRGGSVSSRWNACRVSNRSSVPPVNFKSTIGLRLAI